MIRLIDLLKETKLVPKTKYTLKDNEFSTIRSVRFVGQFEKMGAKYYKFIDLKTNKPFNLNLDFQKDYTITPSN